MLFICDAPSGKSWFQLETDVEAARESELMKHAVEKYFLRFREVARQTYVPTSRSFIEQDIGLAAHLQRSMPIFATLRDAEGTGLATAMLPRPAQKNSFASIVVGPSNNDPYTDHANAIAVLGAHYGLVLDRDSCYPYRR